MGRDGRPETASQHSIYIVGTCYSNTLGGEQTVATKFLGVMLVLVGVFIGIYHFRFIGLLFIIAFVLIISFSSIGAIAGHRHSRYTNRSWKPRIKRPHMKKNE